MPTLLILPYFDAAYHNICNEGIVILSSLKLQELRGVVAQSPAIYRHMYTKKRVLKSFVNAGWTNKESLQGPDLIQIFSTLKKKYSAEERTYSRRAVAK